MDSCEQIHEYLQNCQTLIEQVQPILNKLKVFDGSHSIQQLKFENSQMRQELDLEERWIKQMSLKVINSENYSFYSLVETLWMLTKNKSNANIISNHSDTIDSIAETLHSTSDPILIKSCLGILSNCQPHIDSIKQTAIYAQRLLMRATEFEDVHALALAFLYNFSIDNERAILLIENGIFDLMTSLIIQFPNQQSMIEGCIQIANSIISTERMDVCYLIPHSEIQSFISALLEFPMASSYVELATKVKIVFPDVFK